MTVTSLLLIVSEIDPCLSQLDHPMCGEYKHYGCQMLHTIRYAGDPACRAGQCAVYQPRYLPTRSEQLGETTKLKWQDPPTSRPQRGFPERGRGTWRRLRCT